MCARMSVWMRAKLQGDCVTAVLTASLKAAASLMPFAVTTSVPTTLTIKAY